MRSRRLTCKGCAAISAADPVGHARHNRRVQRSSVPNLRWHVRKLLKNRWRQRLVRNLAGTNVVAPDGHVYAVKVVRVLWPGTGSRLVDSASDLADGVSNFVPFGTALELVSGAALLLNGSGVWGVRVLRASTRFALHPLVYGEEWRDASRALRRAQEIAEGLVVGQSP
jgi:hypothetical protein